MYGFKHILLAELPVEAHDAQSASQAPGISPAADAPQFPNVGRAYLVVSLAVLISLMTYYAVTLSIELYRTIVPLCSFPPSPFLLAKTPSADPRDAGVNASAPPDSHKIPPHRLSHSYMHGIPEADTLSGTCEELKSEACEAQEDNLGYVEAESIGGEGIPSLVDRHDLERQEAPLSPAALAPATSTETHDLGCMRGNSEGSTYSPPATPVASPDVTPSPLLLPAHPSIEACDDPLQSSAVSSLYIAEISHCAEPLPELCATASDGQCLAFHPVAPRLGDSDLGAAELDVREPDVPSNDLAISEVIPTLATYSSLPDIPEEIFADVIAQDAPASVSDERVSTAKDAISLAEPIEEKGPVDCSAHIMESALLVLDTDVQDEESEPNADTDEDAEWTPVDYADPGVDSQLKSGAGAAHISATDESVSPQEETTSFGGAADSCALLIHSQCAQVASPEPSEPLPLCKLPAIIIDTVTADDSSTYPPTQEPSPFESNISAPLTLPDVTNSHTPAISEVTDPSDIYVGPLPNKPPRERKHTLENPDWAVAPDESPKPLWHSRRRGGRGNAHAGKAESGDAKAKTAAGSRMQKPREGKAIMPPPQRQVLNTRSKSPAPLTHPTTKTKVSEGAAEVRVKRSARLGAPSG